MFACQFGHAVSQNTNFFQEKGRMSDLSDVIGATKKIIIFHTGACILSESGAQFGE